MDGRQYKAMAKEFALGLVVWLLAVGAAGFLIGQC